MLASKPTRELEHFIRENWPDSIPPTCTNFNCNNFDPTLADCASQGLEPEQMCESCKEYSRLVADYYLSIHPRQPERYWGIGKFGFWAALAVALLLVMLLEAYFK